MRLRTEPAADHQIEELRTDPLKFLGTKVWKIQVLRYLFELRKNLRMDEGAIRIYQDRRLRLIVSHAYRTVPFYRELFDQYRISPDDIKGVSDLNALPMIDKAMLRDLVLDQRTSRSYLGKRLVSYVTGGSTGKPFTVYLSEEGLKRRIANHLRILFLHGYSIFDKTARVEGVFSKVETGLLHRLGVVRKFAVPADISISGQAQVIAENKPEIIEGYPSRLNLIAKHMEASRTRMRPPKAIITNSETLLPTVRERIEAAFGTKVTNVYDSHEFAQMAWECGKHRGLHINSDSLIIQIVKNDWEVEDGRAGEIVVTDLNNYAMPLIRYRIGDTGVKSTRKCECGITFPLLESLTGRMNDILFSPEGAEIAPQVFDKLFRVQKGILEYQVVQNVEDALDVNLVVSGEYDSSADVRIGQTLKSLYGFAGVRVNHVDRIERMDSGKLRCYICNLARSVESS